MRELLTCALEAFGRSAPLGEDAVTMFQSCHSGTHTGWFTQDTSRACRDEIEQPGDLCLAWHVPGLLYYAEGGWGHHMHELGNHPAFAQPVSLKLRFEGFDHTVVLEGAEPFRSVLTLLEDAGMIERGCRAIRAEVMAYPKPNYSVTIRMSDVILDAPMTELEKALPTDGIVTLILS